jgi:hypothetical protein
MTVLAIGGLFLCKRRARSAPGYQHPAAAGSRGGGGSGITNAMHPYELSQELRSMGHASRTAEPDHEMNAPGSGPTPIVAASKMRVLESGINEDDL